MTTEVVLTGTGVPHARARCAGAGTLVRCGDVALQFDAGRSTVMRLMEAGTAYDAVADAASRLQLSASGEPGPS